MISFKILMFLNFHLFLAQIANDFGDLTVNMGSSCKNNYISTQTITFSNTFSNIPQVIIDLYQQDMTAGVNELIIQTQDITTTSFKMTIKCTRSSTVYFVTVRWAAFDDSRVEVINNFSESMIGQTSKTLTFPHSNSNALQGFIVETGVGFTNTLEFTLSITSITATQVTVDIASTNTNMLSIGFQIVLGTMDAFTLSSVINTGYLYRTTIQYTSSTLSIPAASKGIICYSGFSYLSNSQGLRLRSVLTETSTTFQYDVQSWYTSELNFVKFTQVIINRKILQPCFCEK